MFPSANSRTVSASACFRASEQYAVFGVLGARYCIIGIACDSGMVCAKDGRVPSSLINTIASLMRSAIASICLCVMRRSGDDGMSAGGAFSVSRYSMITLESWMTLPSSRTSAGILPSGLTPGFIVFLSAQTVGRLVLHWEVTDCNVQSGSMTLTM